MLRLYHHLGWTPTLFIWLKTQEKNVPNFTKDFVFFILVQQVTSIHCAKQFTGINRTLPFMSVFISGFSCILQDSVFSQS